MERKETETAKKLVRSIEFGKTNETTAPQTYFSHMYIHTHTHLYTFTLNCNCAMQPLCDFQSKSAHTHTNSLAGLDALLFHHRHRYKYSYIFNFFSICTSIGGCVYVCVSACGNIFCKMKWIWGKNKSLIQNVGARVWGWSCSRGIKTNQKRRRTRKKAELN